MVLKIVKTVWPVMLTYVAIAAPCGMIMAQTGMEPWMVFALSSTFVTGSGQFMICNLWLAGVPAASIVASVAAISSRFALYSASIAPHLAGASKRQTLAVAATLTEETYGISLAKLIEGEDWGPRESFVLNAILIATWAVSCTTGAIVGAVVDVPTAIAGFVCTSLFICLLFLAATVARQCRSCRFGCAVRRHMQVLGVDEYRRAGKCARRRCHGTRVRCPRRGKGRSRCPLMSFWSYGYRHGRPSRFSALPRRLPCAGERCRPALPRPWVIFRLPPLRRWSPTI